MMRTVNCNRNLFLMWRQILSTFVPNLIESRRNLGWHTLIHECQVLGGYRFRSKGALLLLTLILDLILRSSNFTLLLLAYAFNVELIVYVSYLIMINLRLLLKVSAVCLHFRLLSCTGIWISVSHSVRSADTLSCVDLWHESASQKFLSLLGILQLLSSFQVFFPFV